MVRTSYFLSGLIHALGALVLLLAASMLSAAPLKPVETRLLLDFSAKPDPAKLLAFNYCILDPKANADLNPGHAVGNRYLAYLSTLEAAVGTRLARRAEELDLVVPPPASSDTHLLLNPLQSEWLHLMVDELAREAAQSGFDGFFLDTLSSLSALDAAQPATQQQHRAAVIEMIDRLRQAFPGKQIVLNRGFEILEQVAPLIDGVMMEGVVHRRDPATGEFVELNPAQQDWVEQKVRTIQSHGLKAFGIDYAQADDLAQIEAAVLRMERLGVVPFVTTPRLDGTVLGPMRERSRDALVLHGWKPERKERTAPEGAETWTAHHAGPYLKGQGYSLRYLRAESLDTVLPHLSLPGTPVPAIVVIDPSLELDASGQRLVLDHLLSWKDQGVQLLLAGQPWTDEAIWSTAQQALNLLGSGARLQQTEPLRLQKLEGEWAQSQPRHGHGGFDLQAPAGSKVLLSFASQSGPRFDACFLTPWGAVWMEPGVTVAKSRIHPAKVLAACLSRHGAQPLPEVATHLGRRIYFSTVQGEGFCEPSWNPGNPLCAEVLAQELDQRPELPVTVALAEADIRAWSADSNPALGARYLATAKSIMGLSQVEAASNSFSRPQSWQQDHFQSGNLRAIIPDSRRGLERELEGPLEFLRQQVLPPLKEVEMLLWPEGAVPGPAALAHCRTLELPYFADSWRAGWGTSYGPENTLIPSDRRFEEQTGQPVYHRGKLAETWIAGQTRSKDQPRRPIHLSYSIRDLAMPQNVEALRAMWDWCLTQPLHPMAASDYARLVADARETRVFEIGSGHWIITNEGHCRTVRLPAASGVPDLDRSRGVVGYTELDGELLIHLRGDPSSEIRMAPPNAQDRPRIVASNRDLKVLRQQRESISFRVESETQAAVTLAGWSAGETCKISSGGKERTVEADGDGLIHLRVTPQITTHVETVGPTQLTSL